jgi:uncharacterized membrane protein
MNTAIMLAMTGAAFSAGNDLVYRKASIISQSTGILPFYILSSAASAIIAISFIVVKSGGIKDLHFGPPDLIYGGVLGVLSFVTYMLYIMSFSGNNTSASVTIYRMNMIPGILLAMIFMDEIINFRRGTAILSSILSLLLLGSWRFGTLQENRYFFLSIGACLSGGVLNFVNKAAIMHGGNSFSLLFIRFALVTLFAGVFIILRKSYRFDIKTIKYASLSGLFLMLGIYFILEAFKTGEVGLVMPIAQLSFPFVAFVSWIFFKEGINAKKVSGLILAILSILLMN